MKYGMLTVIRYIDHKNGKKRVLCRCDCGNEKIVYEYNLKAKHRPTRSCGCLRKRAYSRTHGMRYTKEYIVWNNMRQRCRKDPCYRSRGITVCDRWRESFENFISDMGLKPSPEYTIERIDNDQGYSPENCRWATIHDQQRNKTNNHLVTHNGRTQCITDWARELGMNHSTIIRRMQRGLSFEEAVQEAV